KLLSTILIGANISSYTASFAISALFVLAGMGQWSQWLTIAAATPLLFIAGESVPKSVFRRMTEKLTYRRAWILSAAQAIFTAALIGPVVRGFASLLTRIISGKNRSGFSGEGIATALIESQASGVLTRSQLAMADRIMGLDKVTVARAMVPMSSVISAPRDINRARLKKLFSSRSVSRIPLITDSGRVAGILDMYRVLSDPSGKEPSAYMRDVMSFQESTTIADALLHMRRANVVMAMVYPDGNCQGEYAGIITLKDLVEEIVGEIEAW
ncbi:MAG TPA: CBS domain-containing protein, partial [Phycisphaerae bacterium]|nr:CBS domain-containing protein [Phycisphaerae bacterium]